MDSAITMDVVNMPEFQAVLRPYMAHTERDLPEALNTKGYFIARGAARETPKGDRDKIESELGVVGYSLEYTKRSSPLTTDFIGPIRAQMKVISKKKRVANALIGGGAIIYRIINARRGRAKKKGLQGAEMRAAAEHLLRDRFRAVGTLRAGWWGAIRTLAGAIGATNYVEVGMNRVKGPGTATPAKPGWDPSVTIEYNVNSFSQPGHSQYIDARVSDALTNAFDAEMRSMAEYIIKKLQKRADEDLHKAA